MFRLKVVGAFYRGIGGKPNGSKFSEDKENELPLLNDRNINRFIIISIGLSFPIISMLKLFYAKRDDDEYLRSLVDENTSSKVKPESNADRN